MLIILPLTLFSFIYLTTAWVLRKAPFRCTVITSSHCFSSILWRNESLIIPALLTSISNLPSSLTAVFTKFSATSFVPTPPISATAFPSFDAISFTTWLAESSTSFTTIDAPSLAIASAKPLPNPLPDPVIIATFPSNFPILSSSFFKVLKDYLYVFSFPTFQYIIRSMRIRPDLYTLRPNCLAIIVR